MGGENMNIINFEDGDKTLRIRKEKFGCVISDGTMYAEGNSLAFDILNNLNNGYSLDEIIEYIHKELNVDKVQVIKDAHNFFVETYEQTKWFGSYKKEMEFIRKQSGNMP
jgi:hypothetical protein